MSGFFRSFKNGLIFFYFKWFAFSVGDMAKTSITKFKNLTAPFPYLINRQLRVFPWTPPLPSLLLLHPWGPPVSSLDTTDMLIQKSITLAWEIAFLSTKFLNTKLVVSGTIKLALWLKIKGNKSQKRWKRYWKLKNRRKCLGKEWRYCYSLPTTKKIRFWTVMPQKHLFIGVVNLTTCYFFVYHSQPNCFHICVRKYLIRFVLLF